MFNSKKLFNRHLLKKFKFDNLATNVQNSEKVPIIIIPSTHKDNPKILKFMSKEYFPNEPTCKALGVTGCSIMLDRIHHALTQGLTLVAKCRNTGSIHGVSLNEKTTQWDADYMDKLAIAVKCPKVKRLLQFYAFLGRTPNVFEKYKVSEVFEIANLCVSTKMGKAGIGYKLIQNSKDLAKIRGFQILRVDATSFYTARICEKMGFEMIYEIPYNAHLDVNGQPLFKIPSPHTAVKKEKSPFIVEKPTSQEHDLIVREMYRSYYPDEPVSFALKFRCDPKLDELVYDALAENISVIVRCRYSGEFVGAAINRTTNPWDPNLLDRIACSLCSRGKSLLHLKAHLMRAHDLWAYYDVQKIFDVHYIYVKREERRQCIPWHLVTFSRDIAADCGYNIFRIISTNEYLHRVCEKYKMHLSYELPYCSYIGADWKPVCEPPHPHFSARVYIDTNPHLPIQKIEELSKQGKLYK